MLCVGKDCDSREVIQCKNVLFAWEPFILTNQMCVRVDSYVYEVAVLGMGVSSLSC